MSLSRKRFLERFESAVPRIERPYTNPKAKIPLATVKRIKAMISRGYANKEIARLTDITAKTVRSIKSGATWSSCSVTEDEIAAMRPRLRQGPREKARPKDYALVEHIAILKLCGFSAVDVCYLTGLSADDVRKAGDRRSRRLWRESKRSGPTVSRAAA